MNLVPLLEPLFLSTVPVSFGRGWRAEVRERGSSEAVQGYIDEGGTTPYTGELTTNRKGEPRGLAEAIVWFPSGRYDIAYFASEDDAEPSIVYHWTAPAVGQVVTFKGAWNAGTNTPTLADGSGQAGDLYRVTVAGTRNLGSGSITFTVGDQVQYDGEDWFKIDAVDAVASVNGKTGVVSLNLDDVADVEAAAPADGAILVRSGSSWAALAKGATDQVLVVRSDGTLAWEDRPYTTVKAWGALGNEAAGERAKIQEAYDSGKTNGCEVRWHRGNFLLDGAITYYSNQRTVGVGNGTKIRLANAANSDVFVSYKVTESSVDFTGFEKVWIDGNKANNPTGGCGINADVRRARFWDFRISNCKEWGIRMRQTSADLPNSEGSSDSIIGGGFWVVGCGKYGIQVETHDAQVETGRLVANTEGGLKNTSTGVAMVVNGVHSFGQQEYCFNFEASFDCTNCEAEGASVAHVRCKAGGRWTGGRVFYGGGSSPENVPGFLIVENSAELHTVNVEIKGMGTGGCFRAGGASVGSGSVLDFHASGSTTVAFAKAEGASFSGNIKFTPRLRGGATIGTAPESSVSASATISVDDVPFAKVTNNNEVKTINVTYIGHKITLNLTGTATLVDSIGNLKLGANFVGPGPLTVICDGTNWLPA